MKLTVEEVAKLTKLSVATIRLHAAKKKLGTREGNRRYFSRKDVDAIKGSSPSGGATRGAAGRKPAGRKPAAKKQAAKKPAAGKTAAKKPASAAPAARKGAAPAKRRGRPPAKKPAQARPKTVPAAAPAPAQQPAKRSFWSFLRPQPRQKISLLDAQIRK
jgi:hypothetical protein